MRRILLCAAFAALAPQILQAQTKTYNSYVRKSKSIVKAFSDSIKALSQKSLTTASTDDEANFTPYIYPLIGPPTYYSKSINRVFSMDPATSEGTLSDGMAERDEIVSFVDKRLSDIYTTRPANIESSDASYMNEKLVDTSDNLSPVKKTNDGIMKEIVEQSQGITNVKEVLDDDVIDLRIIRPNFWKTSATFSLDFTQNYVSENWYKGGNNNGTMLARLLIQANYNDQKKIQWDNKLDMRLGFVTTTSDSCHTFLTNNDKLNLYSKLGVKATKAWYYTLSLEANTQFMPGYRSNDRKTYSDFLAPLDVYVSLGMDYKPTLKNGNTLSVALLPLSYKFRYIGTDDDNVHAVYKMPDTDFEQDFGSKVEFNAKFKLMKNLTWKSRFYYFTSYEYAEAELENSLTFSFSKYVKSELFTLWRFDDSRAKKYYDDNLGFFQFKEYLTLGLSYSF